MSSFHRVVLERHVQAKAMHRVGDITDLLGDHGAAVNEILVSQLKQESLLKVENHQQCLN